MRSLTLKWMMTLLLSSLVGVLLVGLFAYRTTLTEFDRLRMEQARTSFAEQLTSYYQTHDSWDGLDDWLRQYAQFPARPRSEPPQMFAVANAEGRIVLGNGPFQVGSLATTAQVEQ